MDDTLLVLGETDELPLTPNEAAQGPGVWVLSIVIAGQTWRWGSEECAPVTKGGATLRIPGGLEVSPEETADVARLDGSEMSISADGLFPQGDIAALVEAGAELDDIPAEVALWYEGRTWEERIVVLRGWTWLPGYGTEDEGIALTVESPEYHEQGVLVEPTGRVGVITLDDDKGGEKTDGRIYPLVIGRPDWVPTTIFAATIDRALVAQGAVHATQLALVAVVPGDATLTAHASTVTTRRDNLGRQVSIGSYGVSIIDTDEEVVARWNSSVTNGGGILNEHRDGYITGLGDVARWAMRRSTVPIDEGKWRAVEDHLNRYLIDFWTNDLKLRPWEFVRDTLLPLVPVSLLHGPRGLYPVWWPYQPGGGAQGRVAEVDVQATGLSRRGPVQFERRARPVNEVTLEFYPWQGDLWRYSMTYTGEPADAMRVSGNGTTFVPTAILRAAYTRQGGQRRAAPVMQSRAIYQPATAAQVLNWKQYELCRAQRVVTYDDMRGRWSWLRTGSVVQLVDDELGIDRLAWVRQRAWSVGAVRLQFLLWDHA